jgi:hypothetical protein
MNFSAIQPLLGQIALEVWNSFIQPELVKLEGQISQADLKVVVTAIESALNNVAQSELPKV